MNKLNFKEIYSYNNNEYSLSYVSMNILSSEQKGINIKPKSNNDAHIIFPKGYLKNFKNIIKNYPVMKRNIKIWDYNGNIINKYSKDRKNNDSGDIDIKVESGLLSDIKLNIGMYKEGKNDIYIIIDEYKEYFKLVNNEYKKNLLIEDYKIFNNNNNLFLKSKINFIFTPKIHEIGICYLIHETGRKYHKIKKNDINSFLAETIFGKVCNGRPSNFQTNLIVENYDIEEIFIFNNNNNIEFTPRNNGIIEIYSKKNYDKKLFVDFFVILKSRNLSNPENDKIKFLSNDNTDIFKISENFTMKILDGLEFSILDRILNDYSFYKDYNKLTDIEKNKKYNNNVFKDQLFNYIFDQRNNIESSNRLSKSIVIFSNKIYEKILLNINKYTTLCKFNYYSSKKLYRHKNFDPFIIPEETNNFSMLKRATSEGIELSSDYRQLDL